MWRKNFCMDHNHRLIFKPLYRYVKYSTVTRYSSIGMSGV